MHILKDSRAQLTNSTRQKTPEGYLIVDALIARTGIQEYQGYELPKNIGITIDPNKTYRIYRSPKEVFDDRALKSFIQKPVTNEHPYDTGGAIDANTALQKLVGVSGTKIERVGNQIKVPLVIYSADIVNDVDQGKIGLSAGYSADIKMTPGTTPEGEAYDGVMVNIRGNHIAICDLNDARGGRGCRILDKKVIMKPGMNMNMKQGSQTDADQSQDDGVPDLSDINQIGQMIQQLGKTLKEGFQSIISAVKGDDGSSSTENEAEDEGANGDDDPVVPLTDEDGEIMDEDDGEDDKNKGKKQNPGLPFKKGGADNSKGGTPMKATDSLRKSVIKLQQENAYLKGKIQASKRMVMTDTQVNKIVSNRVKLIREAEQLLPGEDLTMLDSIDIKRKVIRSLMPDVVLDKNAAFVDGAYQTCVSSVLNGANSAFSLAGAINDSYGSGGENFEGQFADVDSGKLASDAYADLQERRKKAFEKGVK